MKRLLDLTCVCVAQTVFGGKRSLRPERGSLVIGKRSHVGEQLLPQARR
jgi:hypothetical protein